MGTRSSYSVIETVGKKRTHLLSLYIQYDGYPDGHPVETAKWLSKGIVVNGFSSSGEDEIIFNGAGCLAAQLIAKMKIGVGGVYVQPKEEVGNSWEEYLYDIVVDFDKKTVKFIAYENGEKKKKFFEGTPGEYYKKYETKN